MLNLEKGRWLRRWKCRWKDRKGTQVVIEIVICFYLLELIFSALIETYLCGAVTKSFWVGAGYLRREVVHFNVLHFMSAGLRLTPPDWQMTLPDAWQELGDHSANQCTLLSLSPHTNSVPVYRQSVVIKNQGQLEPVLQYIGWAEFVPVCSDGCHLGTVCEWVLRCAALVAVGSSRCGQQSLPQQL